VLQPQVTGQCGTAALFDDGGIEGGHTLGSGREEPGQVGALFWILRPGRLGDRFGLDRWTSPIGGEVVPIQIKGLIVPIF
jgi:hypothetical protein